MLTVSSTTMALLKTTFVLLLIAFAMLASVGAVRVGPCDQVCSRIDAEKDECCRAHGYSGYNSCRSGRMDCY
uniref:SFRICE_001546 n=1 Tax=Spodoptera frugiperda TaxID=7108 RepID=A0A2H1W5V7_SPOFR